MRSAAVGRGFFCLLRRGCGTMLAGYLHDVYLGCAWYLLAVVGFLFIGIETRGRTIEELDAAVARPVPIKVAAG